MSKATVEKLAHAKMCVAHYGTWAPMPGDKSGRRVMITGDSKFSRSFTDTGECEENLRDFYKAAMGTAAKLIRFLLEPWTRLTFKNAAIFLTTLRRTGVYLTQMARM